MLIVEWMIKIIGDVILQNKKCKSIFWNID